MDVIKLNMAGLVALMLSDKVKHWENLPISLFRLESQSKNPYLHKDDIIMILLMEKEALIGYMGALPDEVILEHGSVHVAWASCIWVSESKRGRGLATVLIRELDEAWNNKLVLTEFSGGSQVIYDRMNLFEELKIKKGIRYFYKADFFQLSSERVSLSKAKYLFKMLDWGINLFQKIRLRLTAEKVLHNTYSDDSFESLKTLPNSTFKHSREKASWIVTHPWITTKKEEKCTKYYFTTWASLFYFKEIKFTDTDASLLGIITYRNIDNHCKILYTEINCPPQGRERFAKSVDKYFCSINSRSVLSYDKIFNELMTYCTGSWFFKKNRERVYLAGKEFYKLMKPGGNVMIEEIDGDVVFT